MEKECPSCNKWKKNISSLNACIASAFIHSVEYKGKPFIYCPWCGTKLKEVQDD